MSINRDYLQLLVSLQSDKFKGFDGPQGRAQNYVLREYSAKFTSERDLAIELPTGAGKTLIALLIAEAWRQDNKKVAILSANKTLASQMFHEGNALKIPVVKMEGTGKNIPASDIRAYHRSTKIAIMNYWVYLNQNPSIDPADLIVMDDAHLAEHCLHSLYSVEIRRSKHIELFKSLITELHARFPHYRVLSDALEDNIQQAGATELLSFIDQIEIADRVCEIIDTSPYIKTDDELKYQWMRNRSKFQEANFYISLNSIWIRPYVYPLIANRYYHEAQQRLYLSATIGEPGDLSRRLGVKKITKIPIPIEYAERTSGRRLVVMNRIENKGILEGFGAVILAALRIHPKSVWLCSSDDDARRFQVEVSQWLNDHGLVGHPTWLLTPLGNEIDQFKASPNGHLFVAGRFDGMDFNADECHLVVLPTHPRTINVQEEFISTYLLDSGFMVRRLNQRIVQALGRCNRSDDDFGVYVLADPRFATAFAKESDKEGIPRNMVAEIEIAQDFPESDVNDLISKIETFLRRDFSEHDEKIKSYTSGVTQRPLPSDTVDTSEDEVLGWSSLFESQNYEVATDKFEKCWDKALQINLLEMGALFGWQWAKVLYLQSLLNEPAVREKALIVFENAIKRGGMSPWFNRMRASLNRARQNLSANNEILRDDYASHLIMKFDDLLEKYGVTGTKFERWCQRITDCLQSGHHDKYQEGLELLGDALRYEAKRPHYNAATDCLWRGIFGNAKEVITFEAKIQQDTSHEVTTVDLGQAHNQFTRASVEFGSKGYSVRGTIVTHRTVLARDAEASVGNLKILNRTIILELWERVKVLLSLYRDKWALYDIPARRASAQMIMPRIPSTGWLIRALDHNEVFITTEKFFAEWPKL